LHALWGQRNNLFNIPATVLYQQSSSTHPVEIYTHAIYTFLRKCQKYLSVTSAATATAANQPETPSNAQQPILCENLTETRLYITSMLLHE